MRTSLLALAIALSGTSGVLQAAPPAGAATCTVRKGETAAAIARRHRLSLAALRALNPGRDLARLSVGTTLKVRRAAVDLGPLDRLPATPETGPVTLARFERLQPARLGAEDPALAGLRPVLQPAPDREVETEGAGDPFLPADPEHLDLLWPVETRTVSSAWGPRMRTRTVKVKAKRRRVKYQSTHKGVDLTAPKGTDVYACMDARVVSVGRNRGYGNFVVLDHGNGVQTIYAHHSRNFVQAGALVRRGQKIGEVGRTGNATGPHLHFELRVDGAVVNPLPYLNDEEEIPADLIAQNEAAVAPRTRRR